eukprot:TRINITY_DN2720_c0_g1_i5.p1 TRINITY_DN2720_c0_g1~~TRINITY_DN2720_c0_g1_i5.p1  ORF type:complete len:201 (+),score=35.81 TRINITY_DN2720_c0_g1_i5:152-754(+)
MCHDDMSINLACVMPLRRILTEEPQVKLHSKVVIPRTLCLRRWCGGCDTHGGMDPTDGDDPAPGSCDAVYTLHALVTHLGYDCNSGCYSLYAKSFEDGKWYRAVDSRLYAVSDQHMDTLIREVLCGSNDGDRRREVATQLFYRRDGARGSLMRDAATEGEAQPEMLRWAGDAEVGGALDGAHECRAARRRSCHQIEQPKH